MLVWLLLNRCVVATTSVEVSLLSVDVLDVPVEHPPFIAVTSPGGDITVLFVPQSKRGQSPTIVHRGWTFKKVHICTYSFLIVISIIKNIICFLYVVCYKSVIYGFAVAHRVCRTEVGVATNVHGSASPTYVSNCVLM